MSGRDADPVRVVVVTVGDELLLGETVDSNAAWLGREFASVGLDVVRRFTVGDDVREIRGAAEAAVDDSDLVVFTGGLGPTSDDRTREAVALALGVPLRVDTERLAALEARFRARGFDTMPARNRSQAQRPDGARVLENPLGTAPGLAMDGPAGQLVVLLPGVPREMRAIVRGDLDALVRTRFRDRLRPVHSRLIRTTGIAESELAGRLDEVLPDDPGPVSLAFLPDGRGVDLRLTVRGVGDAGRAREWLDRLEFAIAATVEPYRYEAAPGEDLVDAVSRRLQKREMRVATAESCTGGLVAKRLTDRPGSSAIFVGGVVVYSDALKVELLGVDPGVLEREGAVSAEVVRRMAVGVVERTGAECGVALTGVAGPGGGTEDKPVGLVFYAVAVGPDVQVRRERFVGDREAVRERSAQAALALLYRALREEPS